MALEELAAVGVADELGVVNLNFTANGDDRGTTFDGEALETVVVVVGVLGFDADSATVVGIEDDQVGVAADGDGAFAREETEEFRGARAGAIDEAIEINAAAGDAMGIEKIDAVFDAGNAVGNVGEGVFAEEFLLEIEGAVVGANGVDEAKAQAVPENILIVFFAKRRGHDVLHAFDATAFGVGFVEKKMRENGFDAEADATLLGGKGGAERFFAGEMDDVASSAGIFEEGGETVGAFGFDGFWTAGLVPFGTSFAFGEELLLKASDEFGVFTVGGDNDAEPFGEGEGLKHFGVVNTEEILVGQENFEGGGAVGNDFAKLGFGITDELGDGHVEGVVAGGMAGGFGLPEVVALECVVIAIGAAHFDEGGGATDESGDAGGFVGVFGEGGHEGEIDVHVGIDEAGEDEFAGGVDDFGAGRSVEIFADAGNGFVFGIDVGVDARADGDEFAVADEKRHENKSIRAGKRKSKGGKRVQEYKSGKV